MSKIKPLPVSRLNDLKEQNQARRLANLEEIVVKVRICLACRKSFQSMGDRVCGCTYGETIYDPVAIGTQQTIRTTSPRTKSN